MENSKLIALLRTFTAQDWKQFMAYIESPLFNARQDVVALGRYLNDHAPKLKGVNMTKEEVFGHLFPEERFDAKRLGYLMNYLLKLGEDFLGVQRLLDEGYTLPFHTMAALSDKGLDKHFQFLLQKMYKELKDIGPESLERARGRFEINRLGSRHADLLDLSSQSALRVHAQDSLDRFYVLQSLQMACGQLRNLTSNTEGLLSPLPAMVLQFLHTHDDLPPLLQAYHALYELLWGREEEKALPDILDLLHNHGDLIAVEELNTILDYVSNYCIQAYCLGSGRVARYGLAFHQFALKVKAFRQGEALDPYRFIWTIRFAIASGYIGEARDLLEKHLSDLPEAHQDDLHQLAEGLLALHENRFAGVLDLLGSLDLQHLTHRLEAQVLVIKACYAQENLDGLLSHLADMTLLLRRDKTLEPEFREGLKAFCYFLHQILRRNPKRKEILQQQMKAAQPLRERRWLMEVLHEEVEA